jgi:hypothetical protein
LTEETTETLYLLGQGDRIVGVSGYTVRPPEARAKPKVSAFINAKFDKIVALQPDLVLAFSDLQADLKAGKSLADEAKAKNKSVDDLVKALLAPATKHLDQAVTDGKITQAQETAILNRMTQGLTNLVNGVKPSDAKINALRLNAMRFATLHVFGKRH